MVERLTVADVVNGLIRTVSDRGYSSFVVRTNRIDRAFAAAYGRLLHLAPTYGLDVRFRIALDDAGKSRTFRDALNAASQRDLVSFDNPEYQDMRVDHSKVSMTVSYDRLPGDASLYEQLAEAFLQEYEGPDRELAAS